MEKETIYKIKNTPLLYQYLRENSYHYKYLYRDDNYIKTLSSLAKEAYKQRPIDKIERLKNNIDLINAFMSVME